MRNPRRLAWLIIALAASVAARAETFPARPFHIVGTQAPRLVPALRALYYSAPTRNWEEPPP